MICPKYLVGTTLFKFDYLNALLRERDSLTVSYLFGGVHVRVGPCVVVGEHDLSSLCPAVLHLVRQLVQVIQHQ